jgi:hypothetical protein
MSECDYRRGALLCARLSLFAYGLWWGRLKPRGGARTFLRRISSRHADNKITAMLATAYVEA